jgi:hypothetical protein
LGPSVLHRMLFFSAKNRSTWKTGW